MQTGRLLFPALRWQEGRGFDHEEDRIDAALAVGVGGFILFGGTALAARDLITELRRRSRVPLLIGADLERGAGQQFRGATPLPPAAALGVLDDPATTRRAADLTAREALAVGVNWVYAPVADIDVEPRNPIVGSRAFGSDPERVAAHVAAWVEGCREGGAMSCAKHFPGHGRTVADSHVELPRVGQRREDLESDLLPFRAAVAAGVDSVMTAHVAYPALDPTGAAATLSRPIISGLLREEFGYDGLVVTDALIMQGVLDAGGEGEAAVRALAAGCDALLYPDDLEAVAAAVHAAVGRELAGEQVAGALRRIGAAAARVAVAPAGIWGGEDHRRWAQAAASRTLVAARGEPSLPPGPIDLVTIDDDLGGPYAPAPRDTFPAELRRAGVDLHEAEGPTDGRPAVIAVFADIRAWKGRPGLSAGARSAIARVLEARAEVVIILFGHPRLAAEVPGTAPILGAWGGEPLMQEAAARRLAGDRKGEGATS